MTVNGKEIGFYFSTRAMMWLAPYCPDGDPNRLHECFLETDYQKRAEFTARFLAILANAYEASAVREDPTHVAVHWDPEEFLDDISAQEAVELETMATQAYIEHKKVTVLTEPKKTSAGGGRAKKSN